ncbi:MAG: SLC13 family permease [Anaerolineae bacterium]|nr:SLC13 family permease [Anaerolineae bacterium]
MTADMWYTLAILIIAIVLFITEWLRVDVVALGVVVALMLTGILSSEQALSGFSNPVVLIVASLFIVGGAVLQTGLAGILGQRILNIAGHSEARLILVIMLAAGALSGFMSDTGTVAVLLPALVSLARTANIAPSKLLIPLSYGALLGGATTLIGTTPNIIVADMLREQGEATFSFFSYTPVGLMMLLTGTTFMVLMGRRILPENYPATRGAQDRVQNPQELLDVYRLPDNLFRLRIPAESTLTQHTIADSRLGDEFNITIVDILRASEPQALMRFGDQKLVIQSDTINTIFPEANTVLQPDDVLIVQGEEKSVRDAVRYWNLAMQPVSPADEQMLINQEAGIAEVLLPPRSSLIGKTLVDTRFGSRFKLTVLNLIRPGASTEGPIKDVPLQFGDILLVQGYWKDVLALRKMPRDFVVMGQPESMLGAPYRHKAPLAALIMLGMMIALIAGVASVTAISMTAGLLIVLSGCLSMDEAYAAIDWKSIVLIAGMLPMSTALEEVGLVAKVATGMTDTLGDFGPLVFMAGLYLITSGFTQVLSNTATTVLIAPIAFATARELDVHPQAFLMTISIAASMAFASPVASPVNTLVMGAGNYRFANYIKAGIPMIILMMIVTLIGVPLLWPF